MGIISSAATVAASSRKKNKPVDKKDHWEYFVGRYIEVKCAVNILRKKTDGYIYNVNKDTLEYKKTQEFKNKKIWNTAGNEEDYYEHFGLVDALNKRYNSQKIYFKSESVEVKVLVTYDEHGHEHREYIHWYE